MTAPANPRGMDWTLLLAAALHHHYPPTREHDAPHGINPAGETDWC